MAGFPRAGRRRPLGTSLLLRCALCLLAHPELWLTALRVAWRSAPARWWRRAPFVPAPDREFVRFRLETAYGTAGLPEPRELIDYLRWCRDFRR